MQEDDKALIEARTDSHKIRVRVFSRGGGGGGGMAGLQQRVTQAATQAAANAAVNELMDAFKMKL